MEEGTLLSIPFKPGTKKFLVAQRILKGEPYDKIEEEIGVKRGTIYTVKSELRRRGLLNVNSGPSISTDSPTSILLTKSNPLLQVIKANQQETVKISPEKRSAVSFPKPFQEIPIEIEGHPIGKMIRLTAKNITLMEWFINKFNYPGDYSDFINDAIEDFFESRGYRLKVIKEEEI